VLKRHAHRPTSAAFSHDVPRIVTASGDETVRAWDVETGAALVVLHGGESGVASTAFSSDGTRIVSETARVWDSISSVMRYRQRQVALAARRVAERRGDALQARE
jgi:WD40 repeat protein